MAAVEDREADELVSGPERDPRRWRGPMRVWQALGIAAVLTAGAVLAPDLLASSGPPNRDKAGPPERATQQPSPVAEEAASAPARPGPLAWKIRGDLANSDAFLAAALERVRRDQPGADVVLFAGTLPEMGRVALVAMDPAVGANPINPYVDVLALHAQPGQDVDDAVVEPTNGLTDPDGLVVWAAQGEAERVYAVVLGRPAPIDAELSAAITYDSSGSATRTWRAVDGLDGSAVVDLGTRVDPVVAVRAPSGRRDAVTMLSRVSRPGKPAYAVVDIGPNAVKGMRADTYAGPEVETVTLALVQAVDGVLDPTEADFSVIWSGSPQPDRAAVLVRARRPDGPMFHVYLVDMGPELGYSVAVRPVAWAKADVAPWITDPMEAGKALLLLNPAGAGTALISRNDGGRTRVSIGKNGIGKINADQLTRDSFDGATVTVRSPDGRVVVRTSLLGDAFQTDPLLLG